MDGKAEFYSETGKMRALFFLNSFAGGGAEKVCLNLAKELYKQNIRSDFITIFDEKPSYDIPECIRVFCLGVEDKPLECINIAKAVPEVNKYISGREYLLITAHLQPSQFLASLTSVRNKCLYVIHHKVDRQSTWLNRMCLRIFLNRKKIITVSKGVKKELSEKLCLKSENIEVIYNPCGIANLRLKLKQISNHVRPYILVMGRLIKSKDPLLALDLYYKGKFYEHYDLIYLGNGPCESSLRERIANYNMQEHVILAGFQKDPEQWLINASLLLSCSKQEGFSMVLAEALICGVPVVATDCPYGPNEILTDELSEYLIYPEKEFDKSISVIASALKSYPEITERYYKNFDDGLIVRKYLSIWQKYFMR